MTLELVIDIWLLPSGKAMGASSHVMVLEGGE